MAEITAVLVKELREITGVGMMVCKHALTEAGGDMEEAVKLLREQGMAIAQKKASRAAKEGLISSTVLNDGQVATLVETSCETDFVARNEIFQGFTAQLAAKAAEVEGDLAEAVKDEVVAKITEIGENIVVRRSTKFELEGKGVVASYIHHGGKIGVLAEIHCEKDDTVQADGFKELVKDITLHIAASSPRYLDETEIPEDVITSEREIFAKQVENKPVQVIEKIVDGKMKKFFGEICLVDQGFVREPKQSVSSVVVEKSKELGDNVKIHRFVRYQIGA